MDNETMNRQQHLSSLADEALTTFAGIADNAAQELNSAARSSSDSFAGGNTLTGGRAFQNLGNINQMVREGLQELQRKPAIARLIVKDEKGVKKVIYIARKGSLVLASGIQLASYGSPIGRLAALPVGKGGAINLPHAPKSFRLIEKTNFNVRKVDGEWDSVANEYRHESLRGVLNIESLRALLATEGLDASDELDQRLEQAVAADGVTEGVIHQIRTAMELRDQPILDQFQDEIFRLPLDSQLIILGPPGTGKTTTLVKRLGQKIDRTNLDDSENRFSEVSSQAVSHESNWLMFTPSELLKHYLKEAFSREQVPASNEHIKTWSSYRNDIARNTLGVLKTPNGGKFTFKPEMDNLSAPVEEDPRLWYEAFRRFHDERLKSQLKEGAAIAQTSAPVASQAIAKQLADLADGIISRSLVDVYRDLSELEKTLKPVLDDIKENADKRLKAERNLIYNRDKTVFDRLAQFLESLDQDDEEIDDEAEFDDDEVEENANPIVGAIQKAVKAYLSCLRTMARYKYRNRSLPKDSRAAKIAEWLGKAIPTDETLREIGQNISFQNGGRRFINASKRYVKDVSASYRLFRKGVADNGDFYRQLPANTFQLCATELDAIVLLMLRNCRALLTQSFIQRDLDTSRFEPLRNLASLFRTQIMVDEATDFSVLQLACMESLTTLEARSFFACGDFNQRITKTGVRSMEQIAWASPRIDVKTINIVYRQSRTLNDFAASLLELLQGDRNALGSLPEHSTHEGVKPVLVEHTRDNRAISEWISQRIMEVERAVKQMPTIAVLVNSEDEVKPMAEQLTNQLEKINLKAVACEGGMTLGEGSDVRVFDIQHIKGLEFEAVFFAGIDRLAEQKPDLFDRYLYVGATRAATYLGMACYAALPKKMQSLAGMFAAQW